MIQLVKGILEDDTNLSELSKEEKEEWDKEHKIKVSYDSINRSKEHILSNRHEEKNYGLVYDKRSIQKVDEFGNYDTLPFGFNKIVKK